MLLAAPTTRPASYLHRGDAEPLLGVTIDTFLQNVVARLSDREAIVSIPQATRVTYAQLDERVDAVARGLLGLGVARGDRVGVWSTDNLEWILLQLATARIGALLVNVNPAYRLAELRHALQLAEVNHVFTIPAFRSSRYVEMLAELVPEVRHGTPDAFTSQLFPNLHSIVVWDPDRPESIEPPVSGVPGVRTWASFLELGGGVPEGAVRERALTLDADDAINVQFTSGTTGFPKAVVLTHHNILNNAWFIGEAMEFTEHDRLCVPVPFYHCFGMVVSNLVSLTHGACIVIPSAHFEAGATLRAIQDERCTAIHGVPTMFVAELDHPDFASFDLSTLRTGIMAGAPCPPELMRQVMHDMGCRDILIGYGETESSPVATLTRPSDSAERRTETVGRLLPHQELKVIAPDTGRVQPLGVPGEICLRGYHVMRGYYAQPDATRAAIDGGGWLHTGDLGVIDDEGYLAITGRLKDMIIRGGENVYPAEIEAFYYEHPAVDEIAVFGVPDERYGEEVGAWIRLMPGETADADALREYAKGHVAHFKIPRHIWFVQEFPLTVTGKIQKNRMRDAVQRWLAAGGDASGRTVEEYVRPSSSPAP